MLCLKVVLPLLFAAVVFLFLSSSTPNCLSSHRRNEFMFTHKKKSVRERLVNLRAQFYFLSCTISSPPPDGQQNTCHFLGVAILRNNTDIIKRKNSTFYRLWKWTQLFFFNCFFAHFRISGLLAFDDDTGHQHHLSL